MKDEEKKTLVSTKSSFWEQSTALLTIIGLWLALPATCGLVQRMVDSLALFEFPSDRAIAVIKIAIDSCLLGIYVFGLFLLISVGFSAFIAARSVATTISVIQKTGGALENARAHRGIKGILLELLKSMHPRNWWKTIKEIWAGQEDY